MPQHYQPPLSELNSELNVKRQLLGKALSYFSLISIIVVAGLVSFFSSMTTVFKKIIETGADDPQLMAGAISQSLVPVVLTNILALPSIFGIFLVLFISSYRSKYFFWFWVFLSMALIISIPIGTLLGLSLIVILILKRKEFRNV
jgi:hypothetical protein